MQISVYRDKHNCVFLAIPKYQVDNRIADEFLTWITVICFRSPNYWLLPPDAKSSSDGIRWVPRLVMEYFPCFSFPTCHFPNNHQYYHDWTESYRWVWAIFWHAGSSPWVCHWAACIPLAQRRWHPPCQYSWPHPPPPLGPWSAQTYSYSGPGSGIEKEVIYLSNNHRTTRPIHILIKWPKQTGSLVGFCPLWAVYILEIYAQWLDVSCRNAHSWKLQALTLISRF